MFGHHGYQENTNSLTECTLYKIEIHDIPKLATGTSYVTNL